MTAGDPRGPDRARRSRRTSPGLAVAALTLALTMLAGCQSKMEKSARWEQAGDNQAAVGALPAASGSYNRAIRYNGNDARLWTKLARTERSMQHIALAATAYQRALDLEPDNVEALQVLAVLTARGGQYDPAKRYVDTLLVLAPDDPGGLLAQGAIAIHERRLDDADKSADRLIAIAPSFSDGLILKANILEARYRPREGADLLAKRMLFDPDNADLAIQTLKLYREAGDPEGIRATALVLARLRPDDPRYQLEAARAWRARGEAAKSEAILAELRRRYPYNPQVMAAVALQYGETLPRGALPGRIVEMAATAPPRTKARLCRMLIDMNEASRALALMGEAAAQAVDGETIDLHGAYATALLAVGRTDAARAEAAKILAYDGDDDTALIVRAREAGARRDFGPALTDAQRVLSDAPTSTEAALLIARLYAQKGDAVLAAKAFGDAQSRFPDDLTINRARIDWLTANGRATEAASLASVFARAHPRRAAAWAAMAAACDAAGDPACATEARHQLQKA